MPPGPSKVLIRTGTAYARADRDRRFDLTNVRAAVDGAQAPTSITRGDRTEIRIGDPGETVTGRHGYVVEYDVDRALTGHPDHDELYWNAIGDGWEVPIADVTVTVGVPAGVTGATCFAGPSGSKQTCRSASGQGNGAQFAHPALAAGEGLTVAVKWPKGAVTVAPPAYDKRPSDGASPVSLVLACCYLLIPLAVVYRGLPRRGGGKPGEPVPVPPSKSACGKAGSSAGPTSSAGGSGRWARSCSAPARSSSRASPSWPSTAAASRGCSTRSPWRRPRRSWGWPSSSWRRWSARGPRPVRRSARR